jgi:ABC-type nitrate/sulfonate/bicarbonate transport system ATPase subunit
MMKQFVMLTHDEASVATTATTILKLFREPQQIVQQLQPLLQSPQQSLQQQVGPRFVYS